MTKSKAVNDLESWERDTPVCSLMKFMADHASAWDAVHAPLMKELGMPRVKPLRFAKGPASRGLFTDVNAGRRKLDWCPSGLTLNYHLFPFLAARGVEISIPDACEDWIRGQRSQQDAWLVSSEKGLFRNEDEHRRSIPASGFFSKVIALDAVQLTYLIVATVYRPHRKVAIASPPDGPLLYARTSTRDARSQVLGVAYVDRRFISFRLFDPCVECPDLMVMDAFVLI